MVVNPNKKGSLAYGVWEKNNAMKKTTPVNNAGSSTPTAAQIAAGNGAGGTYGTKTPAQMQAEYNAKMNPTAIQPTTVKPVVSTPKLNNNLGSYKFGQDAMVANQADNSYLSKRNTDFASDYSTKGLQDYQSVYNELNKNTNFQSATQEDKDNTTKSIWEQMQKTAVQPKPSTSNTGSANWRESGEPFSTVSTKVGDETYSSVDYDKRIKQVEDYLATPGLTDTERRAAEVAREEQIRLKNNEAQATSNFAADTQFAKDSNQWTLDDNQRKYDEQAVQLNRQLEEAKLTTDRQIEDVRKMTDRNISLQEKSGALSGMNRGAGFTQGLNNIKQDALDTINRLQADLETYNTSVGIAKESALKTYTDNKNRAIEKFTNQYKDLLNNTSTDLNKAMGKFPDFADEKLKKQLAIIKEGYYGQSQQIFGNWVTQMNSINQDARAESDQIMKLEQFANMQEDRLLTQWSGKDGEGYLTLTQKDLQGLVESGQIKPSTALASFNLMKSKAQSTINALAVNKVATPEETQAVMDAMAQGMTPQEAIAKVVASNPTRFTQVTNTQDWQKLNDGTLYNQRTGQYKAVDGTVTGGSSSSINIPPVQQQVVENNIQQVQTIADGSVGGQCGSFVNNYTASLGLGRLFTDPIDKKAAVSNSTSPKVGSVAIMDSPTSPEYGHVAIVTKVNSDGSYEVKESNWAGKEIVGTRTMQPGQATYGFFDPTLGKQPSISSNVSDSFSESYNPNMIATYTAFIEKGAKPTEKQIAALGGFDKFATDAMLAYIGNESKKMASQGFKLTDPSFYATMSPDERKTFSNDTRTINNVVKKIDDVIKTVEALDSMPVQSYTGEGRKLKGAISDLQLQLKNEGVYNLGVLNGPDLEIISSVIPQVGVESWVNGKDNYISLLKQARDLYTTQVNEQNRGRGLEFTPGGVQSNTNNSSNNTTNTSGGTRGL